jgi:hypothetical protein
LQYRGKLCVAYSDHRSNQHASLYSGLGSLYKRYFLLIVGLFYDPICKRPKFSNEFQHGMAGIVFGITACDFDAKLERFDKRFAAMKLIYDLKTWVHLPNAEGEDAFG